MQESFIYRIAQCAVLRDKRVGDQVKLEVLRVLFEREDMAHLIEGHCAEAKEGAK